MSNPNTFVRETLAAEASDISVEVLTKYKWIADELPIDDLIVDSDLMTRHDDDPIHLERRNSVEARISAGDPILPLIVLGPAMYLVDGYARYRALRRLHVDQVQVLRQVTS